MLLNKHFKLHLPDGDGGGSPGDPETFDLKYVQELRKESASYRTKAKELEDKTKELSDKLKLIDDEKLKQNGELSKLADQYKLEADELRKQVADLTPFKDLSAKLETERRAELIDRVKDDEDLLNHAKSIKDIDELTSFVNVASKKLAEGKKTTDGGRGGKGKFKLNGQKYDDLTVQQRRELEKESPDEYKRLFNERFPHSKI